MERLLTIKEAAQILRLGRSRIYELLADREIFARRIGRRTVIPASEIERFVANLPEYQANITRHQPE